MDFEHWCYTKQIKGNWKEALYHALAEKFGTDGIENAGEEAWQSEWNNLLDRIVSNLPPLN